MRLVLLQRAVLRPPATCTCSFPPLEASPRSVPSSTAYQAPSPHNRSQHSRHSHTTWTELRGAPRDQVSHKTKPPESPGRFNQPKQYNRYVGRVGLEPTTEGL